VNIVTVKPVGREEYALTLSGAPTFSSETGIGYKAASIPCVLNDEQRLKVLGGRLRIHGESGIVWQGIVIRRPGVGEPLEAQGWGWAGSLGRREALYADTSLSAWREASIITRASAIRAQNDDLGLTFAFQGTYTAGQFNYLFRDIPSTGKVRVGFAFNKNGLSGIRLELWAGVAGAGNEGIAWNPTATWTESTGGSGTQNVDITLANCVALAFRVEIVTGGTISTATEITIRNLTVFGVADVTTITSANILADVLTNEIATTYLPAGAAYRAWMGADTTAWDSCVFASSTANAKIAEVLKHSAFDFGWYQELVAGQSYCVPHWTARETTPSLIIRAEECEGLPDIDEAALDELESVELVEYHDAAGNTVRATVTDADPTHPLVALGITRYADLSVDTSSSTTATTMGQLALAEKGRKQVKGSLTTRVIRTNTGADVYLPDVRPGQMVRLLGLPDGYVDCRIIRASCVGDAKVTLELDNEPYRLDIALAQLRG
jgi:hypothetical protein